MRIVRTWALIADGAFARVVQNSGHGGSWVTIDGMTFSNDHSATRDLVTDQQGRTFGASGPARAAIEPHSDPHRDLKTRFAGQLSKILAGALEANAYERLIIAAPPQMLGDLRKCLSDKVKGRIVGEFNHDLTKIPIGDLSDYLKPVHLV